jgi:hypothetical protein
MKLLALALLSSALALSQASFNSNVGGPLYTDVNGIVWSADIGCTSANLFSRAVTIASTTDPTLYQTGRTDTSAIGCSFSANPFTFYYVTLRFAETDPTVTRSGQ